MTITTSKAKTLEHLNNKVTLFKVPELLSFEAKEFLVSSNELISNIVKVFEGRPLVIRSSATDEDGSIKSAAGEYESVLNVSSTNVKAIREAIAFVIASYERKGPRSGCDEIIVQEMLKNTTMSGVVFTHDLNTGAPYYVINYDDVSGLTDTVTSGGGEYSNRTLYIHRGALDALRSDRFQRLMEAIKELELVMSNQFLDIEFALGEDLTPYLLQVRSITTQPNWNRAVAKQVDATLRGIHDFVKDRMKPITGVYGSTTVLGQMPDWNPAEMIGRAPRALAFSLYKTLITDNAWRIAREQMGYAVPKGQPLMLSLAGQPFIDTRLSFHSYLPEGLPDSICNKLVDCWIESLRLKPELHDKVEFDVAITTFCFNLDEKINTLIGDVLTSSEKLIYRSSLLKQSCQLLSESSEEGIQKTLRKVELLADWQANYSSSIEQHDIKSIFELIDNCINLGTIPFSKLARHGFIAKTILDSLKTIGILSAQEVNQIQSGFTTVATDLVDDMHKMQHGKLSRMSFMAKYGHLRPGTYDILSRRYDQMTDLGVGESKNTTESESFSFSLADDQRNRINTLLKTEGHKSLDAEKLFNYIEAATVGREYGKFVFTRTVSDILELIAEFGKKNGLSRDEMSHVPIEAILDVITKSDEKLIEEKLREVSEEEAERHMLSVSVRLPQLLFDEAGVHVVPFQVSHPNFITDKKITAACVSLDLVKTSPLLTGKIVLIENADPGFDWIFSQQIAGLITKYGGANSHMAIRCAEFSIPAAIGCGEQRFDLFCRSDKLSLDCASGLINPLH